MSPASALWMKPFLFGTSRALLTRATRRACGLADVLVSFHGTRVVRWTTGSARRAASCACWASAVALAPRCLLARSFMKPLNSPMTPVQLVPRARPAVFG